MSLPEGPPIRRFDATGRDPQSTRVVGSRQRGHEVMSVFGDRCLEFSAGPFVLDCGNMSESMVAATTADPAPGLAAAESCASWSPAKRIVFRVGFAYWMIFCLSQLVIGARFWIDLLLWIGRDVLHLRGEIPVAPNGSGDKTIDYINLFFVATASLVVAAVWSFADRRKGEYERLYRVLRVVLRYALGLIMLVYGVAKLFGGQFPPPDMGRLMQPFGDASPMGLLWTFMGASPAYVMFAGAGETLGAILVLLRRTTTLGALILTAVLTNVVTMNFCYDVPVKINSAHYLAMGLVLLLPDLGRLADVLWFHRPTVPTPAAAPFRRRWVRIVFPAVKWAIVILLGASTAVQTRGMVAQYTQTPQNWYDGHWEVRDFTRTGEADSPSRAGGARWKRVKFETQGGTSFFRWRNLDDSYGPLFEVVDDPARRIFTFTRSRSVALLEPEKGDGPRDALETLSYVRSTGDTLELTGQIGPGGLAVELARSEPRKNSLLMSRGFHWVNEAPFNR